MAHPDDQGVAGLRRGRLLGAFEAAPVAVAVIRATDQVVDYANPQCRQMFRHCRAGLPARQAFPELARRRMLAQLEAVIETGDPYRADEVPVAGDTDGEGVAEERFFSFSFSAIAGAQTEADVLLVAVNMTDQVLARQRMALLARAAVRFASSLDLQEAMQAISDTIVPRLARVCVIDLVDGDRLRRAFVTDLPERPGASQALAQPGAVRLEEHPATEAWRRGVPVLVADVTARQVESTYLTPGARRIAEELLVGRTMVSVPLIRDERVLAVVTMLGADRRSRFGPVDVTLLEQLAVPAAEAIDNAQRFTRQREAALVLQRSLLSPPAQVAGLQVAVRYRPARRGSEVGGDWYDAFHVPGDHMGVIVGDVVGHDLAAAASMGRLRSILQAVACDTGAFPAEVLQRVDRLNADLGVASLATAVYGHLEASDQGKRFRWSSAGHPPPLLITPPGSVRVLTSASGLLLGVDPAAERPEAVEDLSVGSTVVLYTDGLVEGPQQGLEEGIAILSECAARFAHLPLEGLCDRLLDEAPGGDDVALLTVRVTGAG
jgi:hypothetical protein